MYCEACVSTHFEDFNLIKDYCAHRTTYEKLCRKAASILQGDLSKFAGFVLARGRSLREVENDDIEAYLNLRRSKGGDDLVAYRRRSELTFFYRWLLQNKKIKRDPTAIQSQLSFVWDWSTT
jgi:site-specific recombinase XerD